MKTALILTARKERDSEVPYPLIPFYKDTSLIDRTLCILRELNFSNILMVVGDKPEMFKCYASNDVTIIENEDYEFTSSLGSLIKAKEYIDEDFLLIEGDTFFEKNIIRELASRKEGNCFSMTEESGSGDECFVETKNGFITKISKDRHCISHFEGELMGVSRICLETFESMAAGWERASNPYMNYEYMLMDVTEPLDRPVIMFKNMIWGDVDCQEDLKKLKNDIYPRLRRREDPYDHDNLMMYLHTIFPEEDVSNAQIQKIGGMSNKNFYVSLDSGKYVLRVPGNGSEGMVERANEEFNAIEACKLGINPEIRYFDVKTGIKLVDYIENVETLNAATIQRHDNMKKIAQIYRKVHNAQIRFKNEFNIFQEIVKYNDIMNRSGLTMYEGWEDIYPKVMSLEGYLNKLGVVLSPCHNDALYENFIKAADGTIYLIDWEYSGMNDPMADFAALIIEADFTAENQDYILNKYFGGNVPKNTFQKIGCYKVLWDYLWAQWTVIKEANGDDFGSYGQDRFHRAIENLKEIHNW